MRLIKTLAAGALLSSMSLACFAAPILTFEELDHKQQVADTYLGLTFGADAVGVKGANVPPPVPVDAGRFIKAPSGVTALTILDDLDNDGAYSFLVSVDGGFESGLTFSYATQTGPGNTGSVQLFRENGAPVKDGLLGLASLTQDFCDQDAGGQLVCNWKETGIYGFEGTAYSVLFTFDAPGLLFIDDLAFGAADPGNNVPEPASLALALAAAGAAALTRRRKVAATAA